MKTSIWGPPMWSLLWELARTAQDGNVNADPKRRTRFLIVLHSLRWVTPCKVCRGHFNDYIMTHPPSINDDFTRWLWDLKNEISRRISKSGVCEGGLSWDDLRERLAIQAVMLPAERMWDLLLILAANYPAKDQDSRDMQSIMKRHAYSVWFYWVASLIEPIPHLGSMYSTEIFDRDTHGVPRRIGLKEISKPIRVVVTTQDLALKRIPGSHAASVSANAAIAAASLTSTPYSNHLRHPSAALMLPANYSCGGGGSGSGCSQDLLRKAAPVGKSSSSSFGTTSIPSGMIATTSIPGRAWNLPPSFSAKSLSALTSAGVAAGTPVPVMYVPTMLHVDPFGVNIRETNFPTNGDDESGDGSSDNDYSVAKKSNSSSGDIPSDLFELPPKCRAAYPWGGPQQAIAWVLEQKRCWESRTGVPSNQREVVMQFEKNLLKVLKNSIAN